jgi:hypothetical protein
MFLEVKERPIVGPLSKNQRATFFVEEDRIQKHVREFEGGLMKGD